MLKRLIVFVLLSLIMIQGVVAQGTSQGKTTIRIMAAASLTEVFESLKERFEEENSGIVLEINYAGSQALYNQLVAGVEAAIFASANIEYMNKLKEEGLIKESRIFAHNKLLVVVKKDREDINNMEDLLKENVTLVIADEVVPVGSYTYEMLRKMDQSKDYPANYKAKFLDNVICYELNVKDVVAKVVMGEVDAGVCYQTDINRSNREKVRIIEIDDRVNIRASYPIGILNYINEKQEQAAKRFIDFIVSTKGKKILEAHGFETCSLEAGEMG